MATANDVTTTTNDIANELLIKILALVPLSKDQYHKLRLVNKRFKNVMDSASFCLQIAKAQFLDLFILNGKDTISYENLLRLNSQKRIEGLHLEMLSLKEDSDGTQLLLEKSITLLLYTVKFCQDEALTPEQRLVFFLQFRQEPCWPLCAACMRLALTRIAGNCLDGPKTGAKLVLDYRAFESALLLVTGTGSLHEAIAFAFMSDRLIEAFRAFQDEHQSFTNVSKRATAKYKLEQKERLEGYQ